MRHSGWRVVTEGPESISGLNKRGSILGGAGEFNFLIQKKWSKIKKIFKEIYREFNLKIQIKEFAQCKTNKSKRPLRFSLSS